MILESHDGSITVIDVALLGPWCPAIHDDEFHVSPPIGKQKPDDTIVRPGWTVPSYRG
jgi:hypothetical protein